MGAAGAADADGVAGRSRKTDMRAATDAIFHLLRSPRQRSAALARRLAVVLHRMWVDDSMKSSGRRLTLAAI